MTPQPTSDAEISAFAEKPSNSSAYALLKRVFDFSFASIALVLLSPFLVSVAAILALTGEHTVLYCQSRIGYHGRPFRIFKFATMLKNSPSMPGGMHTTRNDPRVLPFGRILRATKINELPQLINVLIGQMSLVGPRPLAAETFAMYEPSIQQRICMLRPGLTGIGSIVFRDEEQLLSKASLTPEEFYKERIAPEKGQLEVWYQKNASTATDFFILLATAWVIFFPNSQLVYRIFPSLPRPSTPEQEAG